MPRKKKPKPKKQEAFSIGDALMIIAFLLLIWLILKTLRFVDPPEEYSMYVLEGILGAMIIAWFTDIRDYKKRTIAQGQTLAEIKTKVEYLEKSFEKMTLVTKK